MADARTIEDLLPTEGTSDFQIDIASLSEGAQEQAIQAVHDAAANGALDDLDLDSVINNARDADAARERSEENQVEQAKAAESGDFAKAEEFAQRAEYDLREVEDKGADPVAAWQDVEHTQHDRMDLENAEFHQEIAADDAASAAAYAAEGDTVHAEAYADHAADHADVAADYGHAGDAGGVEHAETVDAHDAGASASE